MSELMRVTLVISMLICIAKVIVMASISDELERLDGEMKSSNDSSMEASGTPDSHEAMNNRDIHTKVREKRSYEFLMGLINNNSRYEVTRVDPEVTTQKPKIVPERLNASELLLELMVRIASHPDQWYKVHNLLQTIDQDLKTSINVVTKLRALSNESENNIGENNVKRIFLTTTEKYEAKKSTEKQWPIFDLEENVQSVNSTYATINENRSQGKQSSENFKKKPNKPTYPKNFTYHRVTGKPDNTSKNPRAYIAVSIISPKTEAQAVEEDALLEKELRQLKPWNHGKQAKSSRYDRSTQFHRNNKKFNES
ncbi:unnamed protein product [Phyllotreta striolata]|uniref:Uncharacterized protein n=1 Tax=Phyllotreta striolata TaxID=444603 RepID=A0A9N9TEY6_PHYSR|nr:unnamed protein product [Phyllotreta striolata]